MHGIAVYITMYNYIYYSFIGYYEDEQKCTFGTFKKDRKRPLSNFAFSFLSKVVSQDPASTGFLVKLTPEGVGDEMDSEEDDQTGGR